MRQLALLAGLLAPTALTAPAAPGDDAPTCSAPFITGYAVPIPVVHDGPSGVATGLGDNMWFGDQNTIDRIDRYGLGFLSPKGNTIGRFDPDASGQP
jgi:hypothetical protein